MDIVRADSEDAIIISELHIEAERETYASTVPSLLENVSDVHGRIRLWRYVLSNRHLNMVCLLARESSKSPAGFLSGRIAESEKTAYLSAIYLLQRYQRRGFGHRLFATFAEEAYSWGMRDIVAVVPAENICARSFIAWCGGVETRPDTFAYEGSSTKMVEYKWYNLSRLVSYLRMLC